MAQIYYYDPQSAGINVRSPQSESTPRRLTLLKGTGQLEFLMPQKPKVLMRREVKLYTLINFFAEVGGYLGLLLGESLISYIIMISKWIHVIVKKLKSKCRKNEEPT